MLGLVLGRVEGMGSKRMWEDEILRGKSNEEGFGELVGLEGVVGGLWGGMEEVGLGRIMGCY